MALPSCAIRMPATVESGRLVVPNDVFMLHWSTSVSSPDSFIPSSSATVTDCGCSLRVITVEERDAADEDETDGAAETGTAVGTAGTTVSCARLRLARNRLSERQIKVRRLIRRSS